MDSLRPELGENRLRRLIEVGRGLVTELDPDVVIDEALEAARELTGAKYAALGILDTRRVELERFLTRGIDAAGRRAIGDPPHGGGVLGLLIEQPEPLILSDVSEHPRSHGFPPNHPPMKSFLGVPVKIHGEAWGNLYLTDKEDGEFDRADEQSAVIIAEWIAVAINNARSVASELVQRSIEAAELERGRWARELHDETLQNLAGIRVMLSGALRQAEDETRSSGLEPVIERVDETITEMRRLIADLRPAALDELGVGPALSTLIDRVSGDSGLLVDLSLELEEPHDGETGRLLPQLEDTLYRLVQEALNNAIKHGGAKRAIVEIAEEDGRLRVLVADDGTGFDPRVKTGGFGLVGMRERVLLAGGQLEISSGANGSAVRADIPVRRRG
ncbi:MAG TPA: GAF domain-containing sensor histidine kinase [Solirubrobacterales bacterium]|nr:GAF domain-containing sensor histidine kinase [Solirubrobacterales bacterium]